MTTSQGAAASARPRTVLMCGSLRVGGTERNVLLMANRLARDGESVGVLTWSEAGPLASRLDPRVAIQSLCMEQTHILRALIEATRILRRWRPRRVHAFGFPAITYGAIVSAWAGVPTLIAALQDRDVWKKRLDRLFDRLSRPLIDLYIADGAGTAEFGARSLGYPRDRIRIIYDGPEVVPTREGDPVPRPIVFAVVARIDIAKKGQDDFLKAVALLGDEGKKARYRIVGSGPADQEAALRALATQLKIDDRIEWMPAQVDLDAVYRSIDVLVVPSRWESVPKVVVEAMAYGKPVVAARVGDIAEVLDASCGILVEPGSPSEIARALESFIRDPEKVPRLGSAAPERLARLGITFEKTVAEVRRAYAELEGADRSHPLRTLAALPATGLLLVWNFWLYVRNTPNRLGWRSQAAR